MRVKQNNEWLNISEEIQWRMNNEWQRHSSVNYPDYYILNLDDWMMTEANIVEYWGGGTDQYIVIPEKERYGEFPVYQAVIPQGTVVSGIATGAAKLKSTEFMFYGYTFFGEPGHGGQSTMEFDYFFTPEVTNMDSMFEGAEFEHLDLRSFDTTKCSSFQGMFSWTGGLKTLDISSFDIGYGDDVRDMFEASSVETVYVKSQQIADYLEAEGGGSGINFVVGSST